MVGQISTCLSLCRQTKENAMENAKLEIDYQKSTLYSTKGEFTFGFKNLPENAIAVCCYTKGSGKAPTSVKAFEGFPLGRSDLKFITILKTEKGEKYGPECDLTIYYGKLPLVLLPTGGIKRGKKNYKLECKYKGITLEKLGINIHELVRYDYFAGNKREDKLRKYEEDGVYLNKDGNSKFYLHFDNEEYYEVFGRVAVFL